MKTYNPGMKNYRDGFGNIKSTGRVLRIMPKPTYIAFRQRVKRVVDEQVKNDRGVSIDSGRFSLGGVEVNGRIVNLPMKDIEAVLPKIMSDFGLVDDGTGTNTWTMPGKELDILPQLQAHAKEKGHV